MILYRNGTIQDKYMYVGMYVESEQHVVARFQLAAIIIIIIILFFVILSDKTQLPIPVAPVHVNLSHSADYQRTWHSRSGK